MKQYLSLCRVELSTLLSALTHRKKSSGVILLLPFVFMAVLSAGYTLLLNAQTGMAVGFILFMSLLMVTVLCFTTISGVLLNYSGVERLLSYPIPKWMILAAKLTVLYGYMLLSALCLMLPCLALSGAGAGVIVPALVMTLFMPSLPLVVSGVVMAAGKALVARLHMGPFIKYGVGIVGFMALIVGLIYMQVSLMGDMTAAMDTEKLLESAPFYSLYFAGAGPAALATAIQAAALALFVLAVSRFLWNHSGAGEGHARRDKASAAKNGSLFAALIKKEASLYFSVPIYVFNTIVGPVLLLLGGIVVLVRPDLLLLVNSLGISSFGLGALVVCFVLSISSTSGSAVSIEGSRLYQLKSMPIPAFSLFMAKICFNLLLLVPSSVAVCIAAGVRAFTFTETLVLILEVAAVSGLVSVGGLLVNVKFPMLDYTSAMAVVKQSTAVMVMVFGGMGLTVLAAAGLFLFHFALLPAALMFGAILAADVLLTLYLKNHSEEMLMKL